MAKLLALLMITFICLIVNVQAQQSFQKPVLGQSYQFGEIVVSSHLNVKRKSKERVLKNEPSQTILPTKSIEMNPTIPQRRGVMKERLFDLGVADGYLLKQR